MAPLIGRTESDCASGAYSFPRRLDQRAVLSLPSVVGISPQVAIDALHGFRTLGQKTPIAG